MDFKFHGKKKTTVVLQGRTRFSTSDGFLQLEQSVSFFLLQFDANRLAELWSLLNKARKNIPITEN